MDLQPVVEIASILVFFIGFYGIITGKNVIKSIVSIGIMEMAIVVFFLNLGFFEGTQPPIGLEIVAELVADPLPQALTITAIIIGVAVTAINLTMLLALFRQFNSTDWEVLKRAASESGLENVPNV